MYYDFFLITKKHRKEWDGARGGWGFPFSIISFILPLSKTMQHVRAKHVLRQYVDFL